MPSLWWVEAGGSEGVLDKMLRLFPQRKVSSQNMVAEKGGLTYQQEIAMCVHCQFGLQPVRLRRRWVHHFPDTGTIVVCEERNQKPTAS